MTSLSIYNEADDTTLHFRMESTHCMKYWNSEHTMLFHQSGNYLANAIQCWEFWGWIAYLRLQIWCEFQMVQTNFLTMCLHLGSFPSKWFGWFVGRLVLDPRSVWELHPRSKLHFPPLICFLSTHAHLFPLSIVRSVLHKQAITQIVIFHNIQNGNLFWIRRDDLQKENFLLPFSTSFYLMSASRNE